MNQTSRTDAILLQVRNHQSAEAGIPPRIDHLWSNQYVGYFENAYGEQALFVYDRDTRTGIVYLGDAGWETPHAVVEGAVPDLVLSETELLWLRAWAADPDRPGRRRPPRRDRPDGGGPPRHRHGE